MSLIYRYEVPVDGRPHVIELQSDPVSVGCRRLDVVEFWAANDGEPWEERRTFRVVGTGHPFAPAHRYWGTAVAPGGQLVWHLLEYVGGAS